MTKEITELWSILNGGGKDTTDEKTYSKKKDTQQDLPSWEKFLADLEDISTTGKPAEGLDDAISDFSGIFSSSSTASTDSPSAVMSQKTTGLFEGFGEYLTNLFLG